MGERQHVLHTRHILQQLMRDDWVELVERLSGRTVEAFFNDDYIDPELVRWSSFCCSRSR